VNACTSTGAGGALRSNESNVSSPSFSWGVRFFGVSIERGFSCPRTLNKPVPFQNLKSHTTVKSDRFSDGVVVRYSSGGL
jgi:hypothetical protein